VRGSASILVVDDDEDLRALLAELLELEGYSCAQAANGAEALAYLRAHPAPELILLDLAMPVMGGLRFREEQLSDRSLAGIPVAFFTASRSPDAELAALAPVAALPKPVEPAALLRLVRQHCRGNRSVGENVTPG
jgi:CheY-like chemotaxis protein